MSKIIADSSEIEIPDWVVPKLTARQTIRITASVIISFVSLIAGFSIVLNLSYGYFALLPSNILAFIVLRATSHKLLSSQIQMILKVSRDLSGYRDFSIQMAACTAIWGSLTEVERLQRFAQLQAQYFEVVRADAQRYGRKQLPKHRSDYLDLLHGQMLKLYRAP